MWNPAGLLSTGVVSPGCSFSSASANSSGSRSCARQPSAPPCSASGAFDARLGERLLDARASLLDALGARLLGDAHQDVREVVLGALRRGVLHVLEEELDLAVAHLDPVVDLALAQAREQHLLAHVAAEGVEGEAVALERGAELRHGHLVVLGDALHRALELQLVDADAAVTRHLRLRLVEDQPLEHLPLQHRALGRRDAAAPQVALGEADGVVELRKRDHFLVDDRDDAVDERTLRERRAAARKQHEQGDDPRHQKVSSKGSRWRALGGESVGSRGLVTE